MRIKEEVKPLGNSKSGISGGFVSKERNQRIAVLVVVYVHLRFLYLSGRLAENVQPLLDGLDGDDNKTV